MFVTTPKILHVHYSSSRNTSKRHSLHGFQSIPYIHYIDITLKVVLFKHKVGKMIDLAYKKFDILVIV